MIRVCTKRGRVKCKGRAPLRAGNPLAAVLGTDWGHEGPSGALSSTQPFHSFSVIVFFAKLPHWKAVSVRQNEGRGGRTPEIGHRRTATVK